MESHHGKRFRSKHRPPLRLSRGRAKAAMIAVVSVLFLGGFIVSAVPEAESWLSGLFETEYTYDAATEAIQDLKDDITWSNQPVTRRANLSGVSKIDLTETLPDISKFPLVVRPPGGGVVAELFVSSEKAGANTDGWLREAAQQFNASGAQLGSGRAARIAVRKIASGTAYQFIASGKYQPAGYSPSNHLWIEMAKAHGVGMQAVSEKLVSNVAGIVMKTEVAERLRAQYTDLTVPNLIDAVVQGDLVMGYTNPFASSTGLNFLVTILSEFAGGDAAKLLSDDVASAFESFQQGVPFVALTTLQMRDSVANDGSLDAFVMEHQTFARTPALASGYEFLPFGIVHDNPLYALDAATPEQREVLELFARQLESGASVSKATQYGFNAGPAHQSSYALPPGPQLIQAQKLWKEKKDAGRPIQAVFLCDISGSMRGARLAGLKAALRDGAEFIGRDNSIGLAAFNNATTVLLPIKRFNLNHKASFHAAVDALSAGGNTAMYDGVVVALDMLIEAQRANPKAKPMLFVLSDGETNKGLKFNGVNKVVQGLQIPIYTIGYEANLAELGRLSSLVEAASLNADSGEIRYKIGALLNAQM
ncbi:MAG: VWA domain-containing protein [Pseudomonadota bacterium]